MALVIAFVLAVVVLSVVIVSALVAAQRRVNASHVGAHPLFAPRERKSWGV